MTELTLCYQDESLVVVEKPKGLLVHRSAIDSQEHRALVQVLRDQLGQYIYPVHRLDKPTSGLVVCALNKQVARSLSEQFAQGNVSKVYRAIVRGHVTGISRIEHPLRDEVDRRGNKLINGTPREATTEVEVAKHWTVRLPVDRYPEGRYSSVYLRPHTGRFRQLRRHMKHCAHPIIGDVRYGKGTHNRFFETALGFRRLWLHAQSLEFTHPETGLPLSVVAPTSHDFAACESWFASFEIDPDPGGLAANPDQHSTAVTGILSP